MNCSAFTGLDLNIERGALLLDWPPLKESADIRNRGGSAVGQRRTTCPVENSEPGFCLQTGGMTRGLALAGGWWLSDATDSLSPGDHCHVPVFPRR